MATFENEMQQQRDRARQARQNSQSMQIQSEVLKTLQMIVHSSDTKQLIINQLSHILFTMVKKLNQLKRVKQFTLF